MGVIFVEGMNKSRPVDVDGELEAWRGQSGYGPSGSPDPLTFWETGVLCTHRLCDPLAEDGQQEEGSDGRGQVAGDRLDVVEELPAVGALDDGDPEDTDDDQEHHKHSAGEHRAL